MIRYPHVASRLLNTPLMVTPAALGSILQALASRIGLGEVVFSPGAVTDFSRSPRYREYSGDGIGLIPVMGPLAYNLSMEDQICGDIVSYHDIRNMFREALGDPLVTSILFAYDTPGGEVAGVFDLADEIYQSRGIKPIYALVDETAYSAGYALASAASMIFVPRTGGLGSIGVIAQPFDQSKFDEKQGFKYEPIFAGAHKNDFNPHFSLSDHARGTLQDLVNRDYQLFVETVARNRGMDAGAVMRTEATIYQGEAAVGAGLADKVMNFGQAVAYIEAQSRNGGERTMRIFGRKAKVAPEAEHPERTGELPEDVVDLEAVIEQARAEGRKQAEAETAEASKKAVDEALAAERERVSAIIDSCLVASSQIPNAFTLASQFVKEGLSSQAASDRIVRAIADKRAAEGTEITSTVSGTSSGAPNPLLADARKRAESAKGKGA